MTDRGLVSKRWAWLVALVVGCGVIASYMVRRPPERLLHLLAGSSGAERWGGLRATVRIPDKADPLTINLLGLDEAAAQDALDLLSAPLAFRAVPDLTSGLESEVFDGVGAAHVQLDLDMWTPEIGGGRHYRSILTSQDRGALESAIAEASARGWQLPAPLIVGYEYQAARPGSETPAQWEASILGEVQLDRRGVAEASVALDPTTNQPLVLLTLTDEGAATFCEVSRKLTGSKLAVTSGARIWSAPIINGAICGGRLNTTMGAAGDPQSRAEALVTVLSQPDLPPGSAVTEHRFFPTQPLGATGWLARLLLGAGAAMIVGLLTWLVIAIARPRWRDEAALASGVAGKLSWTRWAFTAAAPLVVIALAKLPLPGVSDVEAEHRVGGIHLDLLGLTPIFTGFVLVELIALAVPGLRARRHDPRRRTPLITAAIVLALLFSLGQAYFLAVNLEGLELARGGWQFRVLVMASLTGATALQLWLASVISARGLGNGLGALMVSMAGVDLYASLTSRGGSAWTLLPELLAFAGIAALTAAVLRWQTRDEGDGAAPLQAPAAGDSPLSSTPLLVAALMLVASTGLLGLEPLTRWLTEQLSGAVWPLVFGLISTPLWAWLWARPQLLERHARAAGLQPPSRAAWRRAVVLAAGFSLAMVALLIASSPAAASASSQLSLEGLLISYAVACFLDVRGDARARRRPLVVIAVAQQVQRAALIEQALARAEIPCHLHARHLRALLAFFGPFAPIAVMVPEEQAAAARAKLAGMEELLAPSAPQLAAS